VAVKAMLLLRDGGIMTPSIEVGRFSHKMIVFPVEFPRKLMKKIKELEEGRRRQRGEEDSSTVLKY